MYSHPQVLSMSASHKEHTKIMFGGWWRRLASPPVQTASSFAYFLNICVFTYAWLVIDASSPKRQASASFLKTGQTGKHPPQVAYVTNMLIMASRSTK